MSVLVFSSYAAFLKFIELFSGLPVQIFAVYYKQAFSIRGLSFIKVEALNEVSVFAASRRMPDVAVASVLVDAV